MQTTLYQENTSFPIFYGQENVKQNVTQIDATKEKLYPLRLDNLYCKIMKLSN